MKRFASFFFLSLLCLSGTRAWSQANDSDLNSLFKETQKTEMNADHITMVLWMPTEYWEREFALEPQITSERKAEALKVVNQYNLLAVIDAKRGGLERLDYTPSDMVVKNTKITAPNGQTYSPLSDDQIGMGVKNLFSALQPVMTNMLGDFGKHTIFVVFPGVDRSGKRLVQ